MKRMLFIWTLTLLVLILTACTNDSVIDINIDDGYTITQFEGEDDIDLSLIDVSDQDGMDLSPFLIVDGTYDLDTPGTYPLTISVSDNYGTTITRDITLIIQEITCEIDETQDKCIIPVVSIALTDESAAVETILVGDFVRLYWTLNPANATTQDVTLTSSNPTVATVSDYGYIFGQQVGTVTVTITTVDGNHSTTITVDILEPTCEQDPYQDKCIYEYLSDDSRITTFSNPNQSGTNYSSLYPNNRIYYEIFVRKFADSNGNNVGDFDGITETLPYLQDLNIGGLWLMPIMTSTSDHGYNVDDYYNVNSAYGTMTDFEELVAAADAADIDIIIDLVVNHMGAHNAIFQDVLEHGTTSDYYDWFTWIDTNDSRMNDTGSWGQTIWYNPSSRGWLRATPFTIHSSLSNKAYFGYFSDWMPDLNLENPEVISYIYDVAEFWLNKGVQGFRMDATSHLYALHEYDGIIDRQAKNIAFLTAFNNHVTSIQADAFVVTEAWESYTVYTPYFESGVSSFNFQGSYWIKDAANGYLSGNIGDSLEFLYDTIEPYNADFIDSIFLSNHDMDRVAQVLGDPNETRQAAEILLTTQGVPFIYYGDELGMLGMRTNMIWGDYYDSLYSEFVDRDIPTVSDQRSSDTSLLHYYQQLGQVRFDSLALSYGEFDPYTNDNLDGYFRYFENGDDKELIVVLFNLSSVRTEQIPLEFTSYEILYSTYEDNLGGISPKGTLILRIPYELKDTLLN